MRGDYIGTGSQIAFLQVKQCEKELDQIERQIDDATPAAVTQVPEAQARELLACLKFTIDLERIGDLIWSVVKRIHDLPEPLNAKESKVLIGMVRVLQEMLGRIHQGFVNRDLALAESVIKMDYDMDQVCHNVFREYMEKGAGTAKSRGDQPSFHGAGLRARRRSHQEPGGRVVSSGAGP